MNILNKAPQKVIRVIAVAILSTITLGVQAEEAAQDAAKEINNPNACGEITLHSRPPKTKDIYFAWINQIDGETVSTKSKRFSLTPGTHRIKIYENIQDPRFTRRRGEMMNAKYIDFKVEENMKYSLGAKYIRKNSSKLKTGEYWEPIVWKTIESTCSSN